MKNSWMCLMQAVKEEARTLDGVITDSLKKQAAAQKRIFCAPGCSNCCTLFVQATLVEALIVAQQLDEEQFVKLEKYVLLQREVLAGEHDFLAVLRKQRSTIGPCPFLDISGRCSIYAQRPFACRSLLSTKDPEWCGVDFSTLAPLEKRLYLESLDRSITAFPVHYLASTQDAAQGAEARILGQMRKLLGVEVSGNFPLLVYLAYRIDFASQINDGVTDWRFQLPASVFFHPLLLHFEQN